MLKASNEQQLLRVKLGNRLWPSSLQVPSNNGLAQVLPCLHWLFKLKIQRKAFGHRFYLLKVAVVGDELIDLFMDSILSELLQKVVLTHPLQGLKDFLAVTLCHFSYTRAQDGKVRVYFYFRPSHLRQVLV